MDSPSHSFLIYSFSPSTLLLIFRDVTISFLRLKVSAFERGLYTLPITFTGMQSFRKSGSLHLGIREMKDAVHVDCSGHLKVFNG